MLLLIALVVGGFLFSCGVVSAHEAYVLPYQTFWSGIKEPVSMHAFSAFRNPHDIYLIFIIGIPVLLLLTFVFFFRRSRVGQRFYNYLERYSYLGPHFVRVTIAIAFLFSAMSNTFLGPELRGSMFPYPHLLQICLFAISAMIAFGLFTELAAILGIIIFLYAFKIFGSYMFTYLNYLGELFVLLLFGLRVFSLDKYLFGPLRRFRSFEKYETLMVRVLYGLALVYAAINVKLLHPDLTIDVVNTWHLNQFHWLFPSDPVLITFGAGMVEMLIGLFIIFGFEMRLAVVVSLFYITLSLFYFRELVWPHLLLYGISFSLLVQPEVFTLDHILLKEHREKHKWWKRPFLPHNEAGKSVSG
jgi:hypothetical protein